jgi:hypothetical protein
MITASIGIHQLEMAESFSFELIKQSQLFSFDKLKSSVVPSVSFPDTERNRTILNHPNRFELRRESLKVYPGFELRSDGFLLIRGDLVLTSGFEGFVRGVTGSIAEANADKLITDYTLKQESFSNQTSYNYPTDEYACPMLINKGYFKDIGGEEEFPNTTDPSRTDTETIMQRYHRNTEYQVNRRNPADNKLFFANNMLYITRDDYDKFPNEKTNVISPMLFLWYVIENLLKQNSFFIDRNDLSSVDDFKKLVVYNSVNIINYSADAYTRHTTPAGDVEGDLVLTSFRGYLQSINQFWQQALLPDVSFKSFILGLQNFFNVAFVFRDDNRVDIIDRDSVVSSTTRLDIDQYFTGTWILGEKKNVVLVFKQAHDEGDEFFGEKYQDLTDRAADFGDDVASTTELLALPSPTIGELRRVTAENAIYEYTTELITDTFGIRRKANIWKFISYDYQPVRTNETPGVDKETETIETSIGTFLSTDYGLLSAETRQAGRMNLRLNSESKFTFRLLFNDNGVGKVATNSYRLGFKGSDNMLKKRWKFFAPFWANRKPVEGYFRFPVNILAGFDINRKHCTRHGDFLIDRMTTRFTHAGVGETKIEGYII